MIISIIQIKMIMILDYQKNFLKKIPVPLGTGTPGGVMRIYTRGGGNF